VTKQGGFVVGGFGFLGGGRQGASNNFNSNPNNLEPQALLMLEKQQHFFLRVFSVTIFNILTLILHFCITIPIKYNVVKTDLLTVSKIFQEVIYRIPDYQRGYSWNSDNLNDFWIDIEQIQQDSKHYLGVLTLEEVPEDIWKTWTDDLWIVKSRKFKPYYVVDGQQRLTTIVLLIVAILELDNIKYLNYNSTNEVRKKYIFDSKPEELSRSYKFSYEKDNPSSEYLITQIFGEPSEKHHPYEETIYTKNLDFAKQFFKDKLSAMSTNEVNVLFEKVTQQLVFNAYEISADIDVFVTFETMNNRGKPLSTLELLKNRLIFISTKLCEPGTKSSENNLRTIINEAWKTTYHFLGKNSSLNIDDDAFLETFISHFYLSRIDNDAGKNSSDDGRRRREAISRSYKRFLLNHLFSQKRIYSDVSNFMGISLPRITTRFIHEFSSDIKKSIELYYHIVNPIESKHSREEKTVLDQLNRLLENQPTLLVYSIYKKEKDAKKRIKILKIIERFYFVASLIHRNYIRIYLREYDTYGIQYASGLMGIDELQSLIEINISMMFSDQDFPDLLSTRIKDANSAFYRWPAVRYFLYEYELFLKSKSKSHRQKINWLDFIREDFDNDFNTIEHIYPQNARQKYWTQRFSHFTQTEKLALRNSLGNLLALSQAKNSSLSNNAFDIKRDAKTSGYRYGSFSENDVALKEEWRAEEILERGIEMLNFMEKRWNLKIGDKSQKIKTLGLTFLDKRV
jgi:uncharacterized protein with ParB-like and HNH nuclease domain